MPEIATVADPIATAAIEQYFNELDTLSRRALAGAVAETEYRAGILRLTSGVSLYEYLLAGGLLAGPGERELTRKLTQAQNSAAVLAADLFDGRYSAQAVEGQVVQTAARGLEKLHNRLGLWTFTAAAAYTDGQVYGDPEIEYTWTVGLTEHCPDCLGLDGFTLPARAWSQAGIKPKSGRLACGGWRCQCDLIRV